MKKEKIILSDEEKMKKRFTSFRKIISWAEAVCIAMPIIAIMLALILGIVILLGGENEEIHIFNNESIESNYNNDSAEKDYDLGYLALFSYHNDNVTFKTKSPIIARVFIICEICDYIITVFLLEYLKKIFGEIADKGTPFTEYNIKYLDKIRNIVIIAGIVRVIAILFSIRAGMGLGLIMVILSISSIFKYGYKLQIQADETI